MTHVIPEKAAVPEFRFNGGVVTVSVSENGEAFGSKSPDFINGLAGQIINVATKGQKADEKSSMFLASIVSGIGAKDQVEAMLAALSVVRTFGAIGYLN